MNELRYKTVEREGREWLWPEYDESLLAVFETWRDIRVTFPYVRELNVCVQAGGACGVFPYYLSGYFKVVHTFEPDPQNFACLAYNCRTLRNVRAYNAALDLDHHPIELWSLDHEVENAGATQVRHTDEVENHILTMCVDDLDLPACDLIYLDIEGYEANALAGAAGTIDEHHPVVVVEDKGLDRRCYGLRAHAAVEHMKEFWNYNVVERVNRDVVLVPPR